MSQSALILDKHFSSPIEEALGKIGIRIVVFKKLEGQAKKGGAEQPLDIEEGEDYAVGDSDVNSYLEMPKRGKLCCVFLINGQRHHGLDNSFIVNELRMKYLRKRMILVVDLDGLNPRAIAEIMQGSRSSLYEGRVYSRIHERLVSILRNDPDLLALEEQAEEELSQLQVGDAVVQEALDQLIKEHFEGGDHWSDGSSQSGEKQGLAITSDGKTIQMDIVKLASSGDAATYPVLLCSHASATYRLRPGLKGKLFIGVEPQSEWEHLTDIVAVVDPTTPGFNFQLNKKSNHAVVDMEFVEPSGFEQDQYPLEISLSVLATFKNQPEIRLTDKLVVIRPIKPPPPPPPLQLLDDPTFIKVSGRQPVRIVPGSGAAHVRMRWDGKDELTIEPSPKWTFAGACTSHKDIASLTFSQPVAGRFEALIHVSGDPLIGTKLKFEITAIGPAGKTLHTSLDAEVVQLPAPLDPRRLKADIASHGQRRPPYKLVFVEEKDFSTSTRWGDSTWDATHAGAFVDPKPDAPLTLCINKDLGLLKDYMDGLVAKKADEGRTEEKKTKCCR